MPIVYDDATKRFALHSKAMTYAMGFDDKAQLRQLYFGPRLPHITDLPTCRAEDKPSAFDVTAEEPAYEYPGWAGLFYSEPCLKATFADGVRDVVLRYHHHHVTGDNGLVITLQDAAHPLDVELHYEIFESENLIKRYAVLKNHGDEEIMLDTALSAAWHLPKLQSYRLTHLAGRWAGETQIFQNPIHPGKTVLESRRGITSHHANPWFGVDDGAATEESGDVWFGALAWSGNWKIAIETTVEEQVHITGGIHDFDFRWELRPSDTFETPAFIAGFTSGGFGEASRNLHRYQREHLLPKNFSRQPRPVLYNSWEATYFNVTEQGQIELAKRAAELGVELFVVDDGWFGDRSSDHAGLGDWQPNAVKFPHGLRPLIDRVHSLGMKFGIWVEPEMTNQDSNLYRAHPDWVYHFPNRDRTESRNQLVLNLAKPEVAAYLFETLDKLLSENEISFIKWDMNRPFSEPGWLDASAPQQQEIWVRHVRTVYDILERLRKRHPDVAFESCAGGGGRADMGMMAYADQFWTSDNTDPYDRLSIQEGFSYAYAPRTMMCWVAESETWVKNRPSSVDYRFHSAMMGSLGIGANLLHWSDEEMARARELVRQYKEVRSIIQFGNLYRLLSLRTHHTMAVQYVSDDKSRSVVIMLRQHQHLLETMPILRLRGLEPDAMYLVRGINHPQSGQALMARGLQSNLRGDAVSDLLVITKQA